MEQLGPAGEPAAPRRSRAPLIVGIAIGLVVVIALGAFFLTRNTGPNTFSKHGITFHYPGDWREVQDLRVGSRVGKALSNDAVGINQSSIAVISTYHINVSIGASNLERFKGQIEQAVNQVAAQANGRVVNGPIPVTMGGLPGYRFQISATDSATGKPVGSRLVLVFDGDTEYFLNCQALQADLGAIGTGCDQIMSTFKVT